jgi:hypothetical protein
VTGVLFLIWLESCTLLIDREHHVINMLATAVLSSVSLLNQDPAIFSRSGDLLFCRFFYY